MLQSFKHYGIFLVIALFVGSVLLSQKAGINVLLHPDISQFKTQEKITCHGVIFSHCSVRLTTSIGKQENYQDVLELLSNASRLDTITFYLAGEGGSVDSAIQLYNGIKNTKAHTVMVIEGSVYSAHAFLSLMGDEIKVGKYVIFMLHRSSGYIGPDPEALCAKYNGRTDRTQSLKQKCYDYYNAMIHQDESIVKGLLGRVLTPREIEEVLKGHDILLSGEEVQSRLDGNKPNEVTYDSNGVRT